MRRLHRAPALDDAGLQRALDHLREAVRARGLKSSSVRDTVARAALQRDGHFSADDLVKYCESIAAASGGILGLGKVSAEERAALSQIQGVLKARS